MASVSYRHHLLAGVGIIAALAWGAPAQAQQAGAAPSDGATENVVVTSRKRTELLQKIPVSVAVVSHKELVAQGVKSLEDIARLTPSVTFDEGISSVDSRPTIRGFYDERGRPSVATLIDGYDTTSESIVSAGGGFPVNLNLMDLDRVEIVKGPQAALYGRNAFGGAINYVTAKPTAEPSAQITAEVGDYGDYKVFGTYSQAITDKISARVSLENDGQNGFYNNTTTGKALGGHNTQGGSADVLIKPNDDLTIRVYTELDHVNQQQDAAANIFSNGVVKNNSLATSPSPTLPAVLGTIGANSSQVAYSGNYPGTREETLREFITIDYDMGWATLDSHTGFQTNHTRLTQDTDYEAKAEPEPYFQFDFENELQDFTYDTTQVSQEFRLVSPNDQKLKWIAGAYLFYEGAKVYDDTQYYLDPSFFSFLYPFARSAPTQSNAINPFTDTTRDTYHASLYGSVGYEILPRLNATAEVRVAYEDVDATLPNVSRTDISEYTGGVTYGPGGVPLGITYSSASVATRYVDPKFSLDYELNTNQNVYIDISRGTKPAGLSLLNIEGGGFNGQSYKQERVWEYEIGDKTSWLNNRLLINADFYYNDYRDQQVSYSNLAINPPLIGVLNAGAVTAWGEELQIALHPTTPLTIDASYSHIVEYYSNYLSTQGSDLEYVAGNFKGKYVPSVPPHNITAHIRYEAPVAQGLNGFFDATAHYESARYGNDYNTFKLGAFWEPRFQIGVENAHYALLLFINNPFDNRTIESAFGYFDLHNNLNPTALAFLPDPRTFGARFSYKF
jgi:outer membrane receptor protein involved in Fe transport